VIGSFDRRIRLLTRYDVGRRNHGIEGTASPVQLVVKRDQDDRVGVFGGHKGVDFTLTFQLVLTPEEKELVRHYKFGDMPLGTWIYQGAEVPIATVYGAVAGRTMRWPSVREMLRREVELKDACVSLKQLLEVARNFGGEDRYEITSDLVIDS
jgi:hypothetical protein